MRRASLSGPLMLRGLVSRACLAQEQEGFPMNKIEQAIEALRGAIEAEIAAAYQRGASDAKRDALATMAAAMGVEPAKKRGRKPKE